MTIDPVLTMAKVICELQSIVSREIDPLASAVVSITTLEGGMAFNVIPESVTARGTIRALTTQRLGFIKQRVLQIAAGIAQANRCVAEVIWNDTDYPATVNDAHCWDLVQQIGREMVGVEQVHQIQPVMGGEDFAFYGEAHVPGCFVGLGIRNEQIGATHFVHNCRFKVDEEALPNWRCPACRLRTAIVARAFRNRLITAESLFSSRILATHHRRRPGLRAPMQ